MLDRVRGRGGRPGNDGVELLDPLAAQASATCQYGQEFRELLEILGPYGRQNTFERASHLNRGEIPEEKPQFLLYAAFIFYSDTPIHDLSNLHIMVCQNQPPKERGGITSALTETMGAIQGGRNDIPDQFAIALTPDEEARRLIPIILSRRQAVLGLTDGLMEEMARVAPGNEFLEDGLTYFRGRVVAFYNEFQDRAARMGIQTAGGGQ